jgi:DNA polymerase III subunit gamma/tau
LSLIKLTYLQQALELSSSNDVPGKKKMIDSVKPVAFKRLPFIAIRETTAIEPDKETGTAKLIIETPVEKIIDTAGEPATPNARPDATGKLGGLSAIRRQYTSTNTNGTVSDIKPLTTDLLQEAWNGFTIRLKEARNPAAQSFDLAVLRIRDESSFEIVTPNNLQLKFIESERVKLSEHLQLQFNNRLLTFFIIIEEKTDLSHKADIPLNTKEQYQKMVAEYPLVKELKDRLRLELDY